MPAPPDRRVITVAAFIAALPALFAAVSLIGFHWVPSGDEGLAYLRVTDVGTSHTPLLGPWSRWGFQHPGPMMYWLLRPFELALGATGILIGTALLNAAALAGAVVVAGRRGGKALAVVVSMISVVVIAGLGTSVLISIWNPFLPLTSFWLFLVALWAASRGDHAMWMVVAAAGSFCAQTHIGFAPVVGILFIGVAGYCLARRYLPAQPDDTSPAKPWIIRSIVLTFALWLPSIINEFTANRNIPRILDHLSNNPEPLWGWSLSAGIAARTVGLSAAWATGAEARETLRLGTASLWSAVVVIAAGGALMFWLRRARPEERASADALALFSVSLFAVAVAVISTSRMSGFPAEYIVLWWRFVAALLITSVLWAVVQLVGGLVGERARDWLTVAILVAGATMAILTCVRDRPIEPHWQGVSESVGAMSDAVATHLEPDTQYLLSGGGRLDQGPGVALLIQLREAGFDVLAGPTAESESQFGPWRVAEQGEQYPGVHIESLESRGDGSLPADGAELLSRHDPLSRRDRARQRELAEIARGYLGLEPDETVIWTRATRPRAIESGMDPELVKESSELQARDWGLAVYLLPPEPA